jgi:hypothetical protein
MTPSRDQALADLRQSIDTLPERTRRAMLAGIGNNTVITGAFSDGSGVCPMVAADRVSTGARCMGFPEAWDRFTGVHGRYITRPATEYEVLHLRMQLEESLAARGGAFDTNGFAEAIADHQASVEARRRRSRNASGGFRVDLTSAVEEHRSAARLRREREATETGLSWLFEETLVLPDDFGALPATEPEEVAAEEFDFSREPEVTPAGHGR